MDYHQENRAQNEQFARIWRELALAGVCDDHGGHEYTRVLFEWADAGRPRPINHFIKKHANTSPEGVQ